MGGDRRNVGGLEVFHHCVARKIARKTTRNAGDGGWEWILVE